MTAVRGPCERANDRTSRIEAGRRANQHAIVPQLHLLDGVGVDLRSHFAQF
jgi:hypothetical protein